MLKGKKILLGVTGSIAAYKSAVLVRLLIKEGAEVKVIMTKAATEFIPALTLSTLSKNTVLTDLVSDDTWSNHVMLGRWADLMLIAPASCNTISKMAAGSCDNLLTAVYLSAVCPVIIAPAMDEDMWHHPATKYNLNKITSFGNKMIPVENGELASGLYGEGRMAEPEDITRFLEDHFKLNNLLSGKHVLITAGPTYEPLDPVRFIGNHSTGKMGIELAKAFIERGANVTLVLGPSSEPVPAQAKVIRVTTAAQMLAECLSIFGSTDIAVMSAAVADYTPVNTSAQKIKKSAGFFTPSLQKTQDILKTLGELKRPGQILAGFALETEDEEYNAMKKLQSKSADFIILNSLNDAGAGFGGDTNKITIFDRGGGKYSFELKSKKDTASDIINTLLKKSNA